MEDIKPKKKVVYIKIKAKLKCVECDEKFTKTGNAIKGHKKQALAELKDLNIFCPKCAKNLCKRCQIVLSKKFECRCGEKHGYPSSKIGYCKSCNKTI
ncbi:MAG: hypothetical protein AAB922_07825 [Patescibacteria group bacterium]